MNQGEDQRTHRTRTFTKRRATDPYEHGDIFSTGWTDPIAVARLSWTRSEFLPGGTRNPLSKTGGREAESVAGPREIL